MLPDFFTCHRALADCEQRAKQRREGGGVARTSLAVVQCIGAHQCAFVHPSANPIFPRDLLISSSMDSLVRQVFIKISNYEFEFFYCLCIG